jgi:regulator of protease activity HflC (stomatin/prohibitin superfamily)
MAERSVFRSDEQGMRALKRIGLVVGALIVMAWLGCSTVTRVDAGHVGVRVKLAGSSRGVQDMPTVQGWVFYNPLTEQIVVFPTSVINVVWTQSPHEGNPVDESITFSSEEGAPVNADISLSFHIDPSSAPRLYGRFKQTDLVKLANDYIRNTVRDAFTEIAASMPVQEIYGPGKNKLLSDVIKRVQDKLGPEGIVIDQLTINGALRLPENVTQSINRALEATQNAIQAENKVRQVKAEAEQAVATAQGQAEASRQKAQGDADAILIRARAEAKANEIIRLSTSPAVLSYRQIEKWNGELPMYSGGPLPMMTIDASKLPEMKEEERKKLLEAALAPLPTASANPANPINAPTPGVAPSPAPATSGSAGP